MNFDTLTDFLNYNKSSKNAGSYEIYKLEDLDETVIRFVVTDVLTKNSILVLSKRNKIEIDQSYKQYGNISGKKISIIDFLTQLKGLGISYIN